MRGIAHILLNAATVVSLVLCVAIFVLWVRSYRQHDGLAATRVWRDGEMTRSTNWGVISRAGRLALAYGDDEQSGAARAPGSPPLPGPEDARTRWVWSSSETTPTARTPPRTVPAAAAGWGV